MRLLASDQPWPHNLRGGAIALGNFDGFHRGHQAVVGRAVERAHREGRPAIVATFDPHPKRYFQPDAAPFRLSTIEQRARLFAAAGADATLVLRFDAGFAALTPEQFVADELGARYGARAVVTGEDFTFGRARAGTVERLTTLGAAHGIDVETVPPLCDEEGAISSTRIRALLAAGDCEGAARLLTRPFAIEGVVVHGAKLGRSIGYPTANIEMRDYLRPRYGIYAVRARLEDGRIVDGAANLGIRPTFEPPVELLEPHLFEFAGDLYDSVMEVDLISFLRPEAKLDGLAALIAQVDADCVEARLRLRPAP